MSGEQNENHIFNFLSRAAATLRETEKHKRLAEISAVLAEISTSTAKKPIKPTYFRGTDAERQKNNGESFESLPVSLCQASPEGYARSVCFLLHISIDSTVDAS